MSPDVDAICDQLRELQIRRKFAIASINRQVNATGALARIMLGWRFDMPEKERAAIAKRAKAIVAAAERGAEPPEQDAAVASALAFDLAAAREGIAPFVKRRNEIEREMEKLVRGLPGYAFQQSVQGFGKKAFAIIVGEAGNLSNYPNPAKLWKRLGLAPHEGKAMSTWRRDGGLSADDWSAAGYSPRRRAEIFSCVSDPMIKAQGGSVDKETGEVKSPALPYRQLYNARRLHTAETHPDWTDAHSNTDALRIMTKALVLDLWIKWNGRNSVTTMDRFSSPSGEPPAAGDVMPTHGLPADFFMEAAE